MSEGGRLIIDHCPYVSTFSDTTVDALKRFSSLGGSDAYKREIITRMMCFSESERAIPGVVSRALQELDPWSMHLSQGEKDDVKAYLLSTAEGETAVDPRSRAHCDAINRVLDCLAGIYRIDRTELAGEINNEIICKKSRICG